MDLPDGSTLVYLDRTKELAMTACRKWASLTVAILWVAVAGIPTVPAQVSADQSPGKTAGHSHVAFSHALPQLDGSHLKVSVVVVVYGPGESSPPHSHPCAVIGHVVEGAYRTQVKGESEAIYRAGESFYEAANGVHLVSANANDKEPVKFIAYFVCDHDTPLSVAVPGSQPSGGNNHE
jgi:quercetin dioxygenase-like cupin family protein